MLKIKDDVDLKELEKFGWDGYCFTEKSGCYDLCLFDECMTILKDNRTISLWSSDWGMEYSEGAIWLEILFDLIQAGLVEKVEEVCNTK